MKKAIPRSLKPGDIHYGISPSAFMRQLRPEYYSDSKQQTSHSLSATALEYHLDTLTARNQTHEFEIFCRKLCERAICPNLRPQTGPDGGGDSKTDTETFPVADEISGLTYVGKASSGRERWGFAFSAKATWADKVRKDVKGIVETGRKFDRIICITSRFAKAKDRARVEDELSKQFGLPVTIHDRSWIVSEVIEKDRADLAFNYLNMGEAVGKEVRLGPADYSRTQQLEDVERALADPGAFCGMEIQRVTEALVAAKLSRGLERPRIETDGRFDRAIRLADADGTYRQQLEARYQKLWTAFWWYDDFALLNASYDNFQARALKSNHSANLEFLGTLNQLLVNAVIHGHMTPEECRLKERMAALRKALEAIADDPSRPNNSLEARTALVRIKLNVATLAGDGSALPAIWEELSEIVDKATGLGEFDAGGLVTFVEIVGGAAGNDPAYNNLVEKLSDFVAARTSEVEGALILLRRAEKLDFDDNLDMIRWLGKAVFGLSKREHSEDLIDAAQLLMLAYRSAGLLWAARATCVLAVASIYVDAEEVSDLPVDIVPTFKVWAWIALQLSHLPDFLFAIQMLKGFLATLPLDEESKEKVCEDVRELDAALGSLFLNLDEDQLRRLGDLPDTLAALGLFLARTSLLFMLGYNDLLRSDGSLPAEMSDEDVQRFLLSLKGQPVAKGIRGPLVLNDSTQVYASTILGMRLWVEVETEEAILIAEAVVGSLEAFFATAIGRDIFPHTESFRIQISQRESGEPSIEINELDMMARISWPRSLHVARFDRQPDVCKFLIEVGLHVLTATCMFGSDHKALIEQLFGDEAVHHRMTMIAVTPNSYNRAVSRPYSRLSDWQKVVRRSYPMQSERSELHAARSKKRNDQPEIRPTRSLEECSVKDHHAMKVYSVIDIHAWDRAKWRGCGYLQIGHDNPPVMAFLFENAGAGRKIFERWRERFGDEDKNEEIVVSIVRNLPDESQHYYCVQIAARPPTLTDEVTDQMILTSARSMVMEPMTSVNLDRFLAGFRRFGAYFLVPASGNDLAGFATDLAILKRSVSVKSAADIGEHDTEALALRIRGMKISV
ncbi:hypothetical protein V3H18_05370 [Methylocystis sp. 9N]|uniref:Tetratricopeptide repeat protein n=1 Tax=Methylocystis borbori TaxID=3118750 RepID=A0ABU7XF09_9HYPH